MVFAESGTLTSNIHRVTLFSTAGGLCRAIKPPETM